MICPLSKVSIKIHHHLLFKLEFQLKTTIIRTLNPPSLLVSIKDFERKINLWVMIDHVYHHNMICPLSEVSIKIHHHL